MFSQEVPWVEDHPMGEATIAQLSVGVAMTGPSAPEVQEATDGSGAIVGEGLDNHPSSIAADAGAAIASS